MNETEVHEKLLQTWMEVSPEDGAISAYGRVYVPTACKDGITLYTSPARTMVRGQFGGHDEVDGVGYIFADEGGRWHWSFEDRSGNGQGFSSSFARFAEQFPLEEAEWVIDAVFASRPA